MEIISCKNAKAQGLKHYFTGKPCKHGHIDKRHVTGGCVVCSRLDQQRYYKEDPETHMQRTNEYRDQNRERTRKIQRDYYARNSHTIKAVAATHRGARALRVPRWSEVELIAEFYKNCPEGYEVDHILPLQGETVSGLHVFKNLQYLTMEANRAKRNRI